MSEDDPISCAEDFNNDSKIMEALIPMEADDLEMVMESATVSGLSICDFVRHALKEHAAKL